MALSISSQPLNKSTPASSTPKVSAETIEKAVIALLKWLKSKAKNQKPQLLEEDNFLYLILTLKTIPGSARTNPYKVLLPHPLHSSSEELCLIIDDRAKNHLTSEAAKQKIKADDIPISKVLKFSKLKSDYRPFEAKRKLCDSFDLFFADKRIIPLLPKVLGKHFFKKKKIPIPVNLTHKNWKEQIENICGSALLYMRTGTCSVTKVARVSQGRDEIVENVVSAIDGIAEIVPKKWDNVRSLHLKLSESLALPIYQSVPTMGFKIEGFKKKEDESEVENVEGVESGEEHKKEEKLGKKRGSKKGRIHEVRYMDSNLDELLGGEKLGSDDETNENDEVGSTEITGKKRKKANKTKKEVALDDSNVEKPPKKSAKVEKREAVKHNKGSFSLQTGGEVDNEDIVDDVSNSDGAKKKKKEKEKKSENVKSESVKLKMKHKKSK